MKPYNCLVLEDTFGDQLAIEMILGEFPEIEATYVKNPKSFLQELSKKTYQLFIVDIMLNDSLTGIDLIHSITDPSAWVVISSSMESKDYYQQYKDLKFNKFFVKKPIDEFIFKTNIESFLFNHQKEQTEQVYHQDSSTFLMLRQGNYLYKVAYTEILYIETADHATTVYTSKNKYTTYNSLKFFEGLMDNLERANRNTLVNMNAVRRINLKDNFIEIDAYQIQISRGCRQFFVDKYTEKQM